MTPSEWAVLALLDEGPSHGFALARAMGEDGEIGRVWSLRRPRVYYAIEALMRQELVRPAETVPSRSGPHRTVLRITPTGRRAVDEWLDTPVEHVRDARSLLLLKLLFLHRRQADRRPLLKAQRERFEGIAERLQAAVNEAPGFDQIVLSWRLEAATAALRFIDTIIDSSGEIRAVSTLVPGEPLQGGQ
ncbi:MAG TPA: PadR family transcriptional regulator [Solirubrobacteraceae bacterium]